MSAWTCNRGSNTGTIESITAKARQLTPITKTERIIVVDFKV